MRKRLVSDLLRPLDLLKLNLVLELAQRFHHALQRLEFKIAPALIEQFLVECHRHPIRLETNGPPTLLANSFCQDRRKLRFTDHQRDTWHFACSLLGIAPISGKQHLVTPDEQLARNIQAMIEGIKSAQIIATHILSDDQRIHLHLNEFLAQALNALDGCRHAVSPEHMKVTTP